MVKEENGPEQDHDSISSCAFSFSSWKMMPLGPKWHAKIDSQFTFLCRKFAVYLYIHLNFSYLF